MENNILKLKKPIMINDIEYDEIKYDFESLSAKDLHQISKQLKSEGIPVTVPALDFDYQLALFIKGASKLDNKIFKTDILRLSASDAITATELARTFLLGSDPEQKTSTFGE